MTMPTHGGATRSAAVGRYGFVLPPGWAHLPADEPIEAIVDRLVPSDPARASSTEIARLRAVLRDQLRALRSSAAANGGVDVLLPVAPRGGAMIPVNILVAQATAETRLGYLDDRLPERWSRPPVGGRPVTITDEWFGPLPVTRALRVDRETADGKPLDLVRIDYFVPRQVDRPRSLALVLSCSVLGRVGSERLPQSAIEVLVALVDAVAHTFRWLDESDHPS